MPGDRPADGGAAYDGTPSFGFDELGELFADLDTKLQERGAEGEILIVGGAMMVIAYRAGRVTTDVDCAIVEGRVAVTEGAREIAKERGLSPYWLNEAVTMRHWPTAGTDKGEMTVFSGDALTIRGAGPERMMAMKLHSGRPADEGDIAALAVALELDDPVRGTWMHSSAYPGEELSEEARGMLERGTEHARRLREAEGRGKNTGRPSEERTDAVAEKTAEAKPDPVVPVVRGARSPVGRPQETPTQDRGHGRGSGRG